MPYKRLRTNDDDLRCPGPGLITECKQALREVLWQRTRSVKSVCYATGDVVRDGMLALTHWIDVRLPDQLPYKSK